MRRSGFISESETVNEAEKLNLENKHLYRQFNVIQKIIYELFQFDYELFPCFFFFLFASSQLLFSHLNNARPAQLYWTDSIKFLPRSHWPRHLRFSFFIYLFIYVFFLFKRKFVASSGLNGAPENLSPTRKISLQPLNGS